MLKAYYGRKPGPPGPWGQGGGGGGHKNNIQESKKQRARLKFHIFGGFTAS